MILLFEKYYIVIVNLYISKKNNTQIIENFINPKNEFYMWILIVYKLLK